MTTQNVQYKFDNFVLIPTEGLLMKDGEIVSLTYRAFEVLKYMVMNAGRVISKDEFMDAVWGDSFVEEGNLAVAINAIRRIIHADGKVYIETFSRRGYRFNCQIEQILVESVKPSFVTVQLPAYQTVSEVQVLTTPNPATTYPRLSRIVPAKILQIFFPATPAKNDLSYVM